MVEQGSNQRQFRLFNTLTNRVETFAPHDPAGKKVKMYVCGPTVYDEAHLGHARCYITWDVLYRFLKFLGYDVTYVRNVTDVDDKILNRAKELNQTPQAVAERNYVLFKEDMKALNVLDPNEEPRATQYIDEMLSGIQALIEKGAAYPTADGTVYFRVASKADYGKLSKKPLADLKAGARVDVDPNKESPLDFALWKGVSKADPNAWKSPWPAAGEAEGWGRPGWHMECSAMNHAIFGDQIDIHAGGADLIFPHHENEIAQSEAWTGHAPFSKYWMHNGFVNVSGEKMSKSLGNFSTIKKVLERYDANTIRYFLLTNSYRMPVDFNDEALESAENWIKKTSKWLKEMAASMNFELQEIQTVVISGFEPMRAFKSADPKDDFFMQLFNEMADDLNTPKALATVNKTIAKLKTYQMDLKNLEESSISGDANSLFKICISMLNLLGFNLQAFLAEPSLMQPLPKDEIRTIYREMTGKWLEVDREPDVLLREIVAMRKHAKIIKNWTQADAIRKHLTDIGLQVLDNKDGTSSVEKDGLEIVRV